MTSPKAPADVSDNLQILRTLDKADRMEPIDIFDLLTKGRMDKSGAFTPGSNLDNSQAVFLSSFIFSIKHPQLMNRLDLIEKLESKIINGSTGETGWDALLGVYAALPEPKNIAYILDDLIAAAKAVQP